MSVCVYCGLQCMFLRTLKNIDFFKGKLKNKKRNHSTLNLVNTGKVSIYERHWSLRFDFAFLQSDYMLFHGIN